MSSHNHLGYELVNNDLSLRLDRWIVNVYRSEEGTFLDCLSINEDSLEVENLLPNPLRIDTEHMDQERLIIDDR